MIIVTSEYNFINPKLNEIKDILTNTRLKHDRKNGDNCCDKIEIKCNIKFFDKIKNKTKIITINIYHLHGIKKTMIASFLTYHIILIPNSCFNFFNQRLNQKLLSLLRSFPFELCPFGSLR